MEISKTPLNWACMVMSSPLPVIGLCALTLMMLGGSLGEVPVASYGGVIRRSKSTRMSPRASAP